MTTLATGAAQTYNAAQQLTVQTPTSGPKTTYGYDANGARTTATVAANGSTPAQTSTFAYDSSGDLSSATTAGGVTVGYTSDGDGLRQTRTTGGVTSKLLWDTAASLPLLLDDGTNTYVYGPGGTPIEQVAVSGGAVSYLHADNLGSVRAITNTTGAVVGTADYDAYGKRTTGTTTPIGYTGNLTDPTTGLLYLRARDYDPATGQFLRVDPAVDQTRQPYAYSGNSPLGSSDPSGLCTDPGAGIDHPGLCTPDDYFWSGLPAAIGQGVGVGLTGFTDGITFGIAARLDPAGTCAAQRTDPAGYQWARGVGGVTGFVVTTILTFGVGAPAAAAADEGLFATTASSAETAAAETSDIGATTAHGAARVAGSGATRGGVLTADQIVEVRASGELLQQPDGATVRVLQNESGRFDVVIDGDRGLITTFSNLSQKSFDRLASNYGWKP